MALLCTFAFFRSRLRTPALAGLLFASLPFPQPAAAESPPPSIILILSDDQGTLDLGCYGSTDLRTPNLDALASRGVRFTQFYSMAPVCSPSRAALLTGRDPNHAGVPGNVSSRRGDPGMPAGQVTLAETLRAAGRRTALFGKWHLGADAATEPFAQGFDEFTGHLGGCIDNYSHTFYWGGPHFHDLYSGRDAPAREHWEDGAHFGEIIVRESARFIRENRTRPFFLFVPFNMPHYPMQPPEKFRAMFSAMADRNRAVYAASLAYMDDCVGRILAALDETGQREKTVVVFLSDHGHSTEERANFGGGSAGPYRGAKFSLFEGGIRVPCIVSWPGRIPGGETRGRPALSMDLFPTLAEFAGADVSGLPLEGRSLAPVLRDPAAPSPHDVIHWQTGDQWAVREGPWKLIINARDTESGTRLKEVGAAWLSNLDDDPGERRNHADENPAVVARLRSLHDAWAAPP